MDIIEHSIDEKRVIPWMRGHWYWSFFYSALYLALIFFGQKLMKDRQPYNLRRALCMWSTGLSVFSFYAMFRIMKHAYYMVHVGGWEHAICDTRSYIGSTGAGLWAFLFPLSKLPELVDTAFIVLRKQKMVFLHWYHHISVFIYCWFSYAFPISTGIWFGIVNYSVHAIMYAYYAIKASGRHPPRWIARCITTIQLSQMFAGLFLNYVAAKTLYYNKTCAMSPFTIGLSIFFYVSYAILFGNFYYWTYIHVRPKKVEDGSKMQVKDLHAKTNGFVASSDACSTVTELRMNEHVANGGVSKVGVPNGIPKAMVLRNGKVANGLTNEDESHDLRSRSVKGVHKTWLSCDSVMWVSYEYHMTVEMTVNMCNYRLCRTGYWIFSFVHT